VRIRGFQKNIFFQKTFLCVLQGKVQEPAPVFTGLDAGLERDSVQPNGSERYAVSYQISVFSIPIMFLMLL